MNAVTRAQHEVLKARINVEAAKAATAAERATPEKAMNDDWSARVDMLDVLIEKDHELWSLAADRLLKAWEADGCSDRMAEKCRAFYDRERAAELALREAERALISLCAKKLPPHSPNPIVSKLFADAIAGKLWRGGPTVPGPLNKLVDICMCWNGRRA